MTTKPLTLKEFLGQVREVLEVAYPLQYRITAEIAQINLYHQSGHCFPILVEKEGDVVVAKVSGVIWRTNLEGILKRFRDTLGEELREGMKVLCTVEVRFHELYGLSLNIIDIDPSYTLGEFALTRQKILAQLEKEGLINKNKQVPFPIVPQRIAVISSESSAGYEDFLNTINNNPYGYRFSVTLFPAYMQGQYAEPSILDALNRCLKRIDGYDILVMIRGGGDNIDLHCFDSYNIGKAIACFPIPVLSGIGHTRDETVVDVVSYKKMITPTDAGKFIVEKAKGFEEYIEEMRDRIIDITERVVTEQKMFISNSEKHLNVFTNFFIHNTGQRFNSVISDFKNNLSKCIGTRGFYLQNIPDRISSALRLYIKSHINFLERMDEKVSLMSPVNVLKRGYSITFRNGKVIKNVKDVAEGDIIETLLHKGKIKSKVEAQNGGE